MEDFLLKMRFVRGSPMDFYRPSADAETVLAERRSWMATEPDTCVAITHEAVPLLEELIELAHEWKTLPQGCDLASLTGLPAREQCHWLSEHWETDFLLLRPEADGKFRLQGGGLCFPSHWDLNSKMGLTVAEIHEPVPGLNDELGRSIDGFLAKIRPGISWERHNWGISRSPELNQHPSRDIQPLNETVDLEEVWWRLEEQSLVALPKSGGVLFGIRVTVHPLLAVQDHPAARQGLLQALETMPDDMAAYKGVLKARNKLCSLLRT